jgi:hypothetical protein
MRNTWKKASEGFRVMVAEISRHVGPYSYESPEASERTEEAMDSFVRDSMESIKDAMHTLMNLDFELRKDGISDEAREVMDLASGIQAATVQGEEPGRLPLEFMKRLIMKDSVIVLGVVQAVEEACSLKERFHRAMKDDGILDKELPGMKKSLKDMITSLERLSDVIRERDKIKGISGEVMRKAAESLEEEG